MSSRTGATAPGLAADPVADALAAMVAGHLGDPHHVLGPHRHGARLVVRAWRPEAEGVTLEVDGSEPVAMERVNDAGVFAASVAAPPGDEVPAYRFEVAYPGGHSFTVDDPYRFWPTLGDLDLHLFGEGRHHELWHHLGAHPRVHQGVAGTAFAVWAPSARSVRVVGDFNSWDGRLHPMRALGGSGVWELFLPGVGAGACYKFEILTDTGAVALKADPFAFATQAPPETASVVTESTYEWGDGAWLESRAATDPMRRPMSVYEVHLGSWRRVPEDGDRPLTYRELADQLPEYAAGMGFTHVELMPIAEHPFTGSWGYQVSAYYAPTARFGSPDDFRALVDALHARGIGVVVDWVPAHFPKDAFALARFDGTALYEHADPRQGEHPDWGTLVFNLGRNEVRNFLVANALYWIEEFHIDGLRVDAVASMLYLDYSRKEGEWVPNRFGGRENLEAVDFLKEVNTVVYGTHPGVMTVAEESTAWPAVSKPIYLGGLGFGFKWNMGWMHDTLQYFAKEPVYRRHHHSQLTFGLLYAFSENFVLPLSHDEVVHGKGSLLNKMPGDTWSKLANLRALFGWMWAHPGSRLLFMGGELAQWQEWSHDRSLDWHLLDDPGHAGVQALVRELNALATTEPAIWEREYDPAGFRWIDANDADQNVLSFARFSADGSRALVCVANLSAVPRGGYRIGLPRPGRWKQVLDTSSAAFGGENPEAVGDRWADPVAWHGLDQSVALDVAPLSVVWLSSAD
ncbi:MAG: 1,4-alpha-glucan branching protein GlgB [Acidimicrobiales bacterium]